MLDCSDVTKSYSVKQFGDDSRPEEASELSIVFGSSLNEAAYFQVRFELFCKMHVS